MKMQISAVLLIAVVFINFTQGKIFNPKTSEEFQSAINEAAVADLIELLPQDYRGDFVLPNKSGPVTIKGTSTPNSKTFTKIVGIEKAFSISGDKWRLQDLVINSGDVGIEVRGSNSTLNSLTISEVGKGIVINGNDNFVESVTIQDSTQGILVNGSRNAIQSVTIQDMSKESIIVESGSTSTIIDSVSVITPGNHQESVILWDGSSQGILNSLTLDGIVNIRGDNYRISSCSFLYALNLFGRNNVIERSTIQIFYTNNTAENSVGSTNSIKEIRDTPVSSGAVKFGTFNVFILFVCLIFGSVY